MNDEYDSLSKGTLKERVARAFEDVTLSKEDESDLLMDLMGQKKLETRFYFTCTRI